MRLHIIANRLLGSMLISDAFYTGRIFAALGGGESALLDQVQNLTPSRVKSSLPPFLNSSLVYVHFVDQICPGQFSWKSIGMFS